ncbi:hypothetical protein V8C40DRAFT_174955 [Trichoderma camerunense]
MPGCCGHLRQTSIRTTATNKSNIPALETKTTKLGYQSPSTIQPIHSNLSNQSSIIMSLIGHHGGLQIGKAERPGPSLGKKINKDHESKSEKTSSSLSQRIGGILHSQRRGDDRSETASISSVATEKRALLGDRNSSSSSRQTSKLAKPNETLMPPVRFWN